MIHTKTRFGFVYTNSYAGRRENRVEIIRETPKRYEIRAITRTKLAGRDRWLENGEVAMVPKWAVTLEAE